MALVDVITIVTFGLPVAADKRESVIKAVKASPQALVVDAFFDTEDCLLVAVGAAQSVEDFESAVLKQARLFDLYITEVHSDMYASSSEDDAADFLDER
jgi:hypothetical protein